MLAAQQYTRRIDTREGIRDIRPRCEPQRRTSQPTGGLLQPSMPRARPDAAGADDPVALGHRPSPELRRVLANIRVVIALVATIESVALSVLGQPPVSLALLGYTAYAGWLAWLEASGRRAPLSRLTSWIDALWILLIAQLAAAPGSLFMLLLLFPVLFASLSFGVLSGMLVSAFAAFGALLVVHGHGEALTFSTLLFPAAILVLGPLVAGLARPGVELNEQVSVADRLFEQADPRLGLERVARVIVRSLTRRFEADLGLLLIWLPGREPRLFRCDGAFQVREIDGEPRTALLERMSRLPRDIAGVRDITHLPGRHRIPRYSGFHIISRQPAAADRPALEALGELLDAHSLASIPICRRSPQPCWLVLESARRHYRARDAELLVRVMEQLAPVIENAGLLEQLCDEAAATERARIGRDLHDTAIQPYLGIKYGIEALARKARIDNPLHDDIVALKEMATSELHELRETVSHMRAGVARGEDTLAPALRRQARRFSELFGIDVAVHCDGDIPINRQLSAAFFHMVSEALTNIRRHTHATRAEIRVTVAPDAFVVHISNDHGPEPPPASFRPRSIAERAESLHGRAIVDTARPGLTDLIITIPRLPEA